MPDVVDLIKNDHREVERLFDLLRDPASRAQNVPVLVTLLTAHSRAEEAAVYPVARDEAGAADTVAHSQTEHAEADELLKRLESADPESDDFDSVLDELVHAVSHHVEEEESTVLPAMSQGLDDTRRDELAEAFLASRAEHIGDTPEDITLAERRTQAANADIDGRGSKSKDEIAEELAAKAKEEESEEE
ncbi:hemerythrin domain-containing protein [Monashia sp. NPDC004114]